MECGKKAIHKENMRELPVDRVVRTRREDVTERRRGDKGERWGQVGRAQQIHSSQMQSKEPESESRTAAKKANKKQSEE